MKRVPMEQFRYLLKMAWEADFNKMRAFEKSQHPSEREAYSEAKARLEFTEAIEKALDGDSSLLATYRY